MIGELINTGMTFGAGRAAINTAFSGTATFNILTANTLSATTIFSGGTDLSSLLGGGTSGNLFSGSTGPNSIIANNGTGNIAAGDFSIAGGSGSTSLSAFSYSFGEGSISKGLYSHAHGAYCLANLPFSHAEGLICTADTYAFSFGWASNASEGSIVFGIGNNAIGQYSHVVGIANTAYGYNSIVMGQANVSSGQSSIVIGNNSVALAETAFAGGFGASAMTTNSFVYSYASLTNGNMSAILAGSANTISNTALNSVILGMTNFSATSANTTYMTNSYVDGYFDLNPQTVLPTPKIGRLFFSGTPLNRLMQNTGGTSSSWCII
jgi:hypothetical protein